MINEDIEVAAWYSPHRRYGELVCIEYDYDEEAYVICCQLILGHKDEINPDEAYSRRKVSDDWMLGLMSRLEKTSLPFYSSNHNGGSFGGTWFGLKISSTTREVAVCWQTGINQQALEIQALWQHIVDAGSENPVGDVDGQGVQ